MRLVQYWDQDGRRAVAASHGEGHTRLEDIETVYEMALESIEAGRSLEATARTYLGARNFDLDAAEREGRLLPPIEHPVPTRCWVTASELALTATATPDGGTGAAWYFRGNGSTLVGGGLPLAMPEFARASAPLPRLAGLYVIGEDGTPCRVGWALGHPLTDLRAQGAGGGHGHLRRSAVGPELLLGEVPEDATATAALLRGGAPVGQRTLALVPGGRTMIDRLTAEHFRYEMHRRPGDVHIQFYGQAPAPSEDIEALPDDVFSVHAAAFGHALVNPLAIGLTAIPAVRVL